MHHPPRTPRVLWLLTKVAAARLLRFSAMQQQRRRNKAARKLPKRSTSDAAAPRRRATSRKRMDGTTWMLVAFLPLFLLQALMMTGQGSRTLANE